MTGSLNQEDELLSGGTVPQPAPRSFFGFVPRWLRLAAMPVAAVALAGSLIHVPYYSVGPGPATDVLSLIEVEGARTYASKGKLLLMTATVSDRPLNVWEAVRVWIDPSVSAVSRETIVPAGVTDEEQDAKNFRDMEESKIAAEVAAFRALGKKVTTVSGARVLTVIPGSASEGKLRARDLIVAIDGERVADPDAVVKAIQRRAIGDLVRVTVRRGTETVDVPIRTRRSIGEARKPAVGVTLGRAFRLPHDVEIDTRRIGGPSGGLVFALSLFDAFTEEDLTRGYIVAATGTISLGDGPARVGNVGAVAEKVRAAVSVNADVFLVPAEEEAEARRAAPAGLRVIGVGTLDAALAALRALPAR